MRRLLPILAILLLAAGARFHLLDAQSLWHDEGNSVVQAARNLPAIVDNAARDIHPPGYYALLHVWRGLTGETEFALRSLSVLASVLGIACAYALGTRLNGRLAGGAAAAFIALNTFSIYYAQETRMYALLALWGAASMWVLVRLMDGAGRTWPQVVALGLLNAAGLYTHYAFPFVMLAQGALVLLWLIADVAGWWQNRATTRPVLSLRSIAFTFTAANLLALALYAPWLGTAWEQITTWPTTGERIPPVEAIAQMLGWFGFGITVESGTTIAVAFFALFGLLVLPGSTRRGWWRMLVPVVWVVVSVGAFLALDLFREANLKFLLPAQIAFALWIGRGVAALWSVQVRRGSADRVTRWRQSIPRLAALVGTFALLVTLWEGLNPLYHAAAYQRDDYRGMASRVGAELGPDDAVILSAPNQQEVFAYYYDGPTPVYALPPGLGGDDAATRATVTDVIADSGLVYALLWATAERDPNSVVEGTLDTQAYPVDSRWYGDVRFVRYVTPRELAVVREVGAGFGEAITLTEAAWNADRFTGDGEDAVAVAALQIRLTWRTESPLATRYRVFVQLLAPDGTLAVQRDGDPGGALLTPDWPVAEPVTGNQALILPPDLPPGTYTLITGLYDAADPMNRLPVTLPPGSPFAAGDGYVILGEIVIE